jgi:mRNA interferase YafQ
MKIIYTRSFKKDFKKIAKQNKNLNLLGDIIKKISLKQPLDLKFRDHSLIANYKGARECHLTPDWLLIYEIDFSEDALILHRTGSHSELF